MSDDRADDDELRLLVQQLARRIRKNRSDERISDSQLGVLFRLEKHGPVGPSRLAAEERVTPPSINRMVNSLEGAGLVVREPDPDDARKVLIRLTDDGSSLISETRRLRSAWFTQRLAELSADERLALAEVTPILRRLADS